MQVKWSFKKVLASSVMALLLANSAYAIPRAPCDPKPSKDVCCEEPKPGPFAFSFPKDMNLTCPRDFYVRAEFLAMQAQEDGLNYGIVDGSTAGTLPLTNGNVLGFSSGHHDWDWDFGFRLGMGFHLNHDAWNVDVSWLWYNMNQEVSTRVESGACIIPLFAPAQSSVPNASHESASSRWHLAMNVFDVALGKPHHISRYMVMSPHFGLRGAWIDQDLAWRYSGSFNSVGSAKSTAKNDFWGIGSRAGIQTDWILGADWHLIANLSVSSLFGKFDVDQHFPGTNGYDYKDGFFRNTTNMEIQTGIAWGTHFSNNCYHVTLQALYEFHHWTNQLWTRITQDSAATHLSDNVSRGDLSINGVSVRCQFDF